MGTDTKKSLVISRILVTLGTLAIFVVVLAFFAPVIVDRHLVAYEAAAASSLRRIDSSNIAYANDHPQLGYARTLSDLAERPTNARPGEIPEWVIDPVLASGEKGGYKFTYSAQSKKGDGKIDAFQITADPLVPGKTGKRHFFVDQTGTIRMSDTGPANPSSVVFQ